MCSPGREAVEIVGALVDEHGDATDGGNSRLFADRDEGWILVEFAGGRGPWVAERPGPEAVRVSRPGDIGEAPLDFEERPGFMGSPHLVSLAVERLCYLVAEHPDEFLPEVTRALEAFEARRIAAQPTAERVAAILIEHGEPDLARAYLTSGFAADAAEALRLAEALSASIEARTRLRFGIRAPE